jgi:hypothetical protein
MLIISKFKDYYDTAIGVGGIDKSLVYQRITTEIEVDIFSKYFKEFCTSHGLNHLPFNYWGDRRKDGLEHYFPLIVGFCGKLYVGYVFVYSSISPQNPNGIKRKKIIYDFENTIKILRIDKKHYQYELLKNFFTLQGKEDLKIFREYNVPAFAFEFKPGNNQTLVLNPFLKDYELYKRFNAFQAHQEIEMFLGGVLGKPEKEIIEISEKDKLIQHGMDKWSFKNPDPPKRKQK